MPSIPSPQDPPQVCECGCGHPVPIAVRTRRGLVAGQPCHFLKGHHAKLRYADKEARFWARVDKSGGPDACWPWTGGCYPNGYGKICWNGRDGLTHRIAWEITNGPIPAGQNVCHRCDNPPCCNPAHHFLGTQAQNLNDMTRKGRRRWGVALYRKMTPKLVLSLRERHEREGIPWHQLARECGVSTSTISRAIKRFGL